MADFPRRSKAFDPMAYRSQASYNAHMSRHQSNKQSSEPTKSIEPMTNLNQAACDASRGQSNEKPSESAKTFNKNAYRRQTTCKASMARLQSNDKPKPSELAKLPKPMTNVNQATYAASRRQPKDKHIEPTKTFDKNVDRKQPASDFSRGVSKDKQVEPAKPFNKMAYRSSHPSRGRSYQKHAKSTKPQQPRVAHKSNAAQHHRPTMKLTTYAEEQAKEDACVKNWFAEANADYEAAKKRGEFDRYVPAAGRTPDFTKFRQMFDADGKPVNGLGNFRHAEADQTEKK